MKSTGTNKVSVIGSARALRVGLVGMGAVGEDVAARLLRGDVPGVRLAAVCVNDASRARARLAALNAPDVAVLPLAELVEACDIVCECASVDAFADIARAVLGAGKTLIAISVSALPRCPDLVDLATRHGGQLRVAGGGLAGLDILRAVCEDDVHSVHLTTRFRPQSMAHDPYVRSRGVDCASLNDQAIEVFSGTVREAARAFPRHFNVAFALSLAGIGPDRTTVTVMLDPNVEGTVQSVEVKADSADLTLESRTRPSRIYRSSRIVAPSVVAALRTYVAPIHVGT
jgi:aspartate dehydrogenase